MIAGKEIAYELNEYYFDEAYFERDMPYFEYMTDGDIENIVFAGICIFEWDDDYKDDVVSVCKQNFNEIISEVFQKSADAQCREMEKDS